MLVNNAAYQQHQKSIEDITDEQLDRTFRTNIYGYFFMTRAALPHLNAGSAIINTGSITGLEAAKNFSITARPRAPFTPLPNRSRRT